VENKSYEFGEGGGMGQCEQFLTGCCQQIGAG
jgi:hypothetical protein